MFEAETDSLFQVFSGDAPTDNFDDALDESFSSDDEKPMIAKRQGSEGLEATTKKQKVTTEPISRARDDISAPVVADTFEQETSRAVANIAGLQATTSEEGEKLVLSHQVRHQVAVPPNYPYVPISKHVPPADPARVYPFTLDPFQRVAVSSIERNESVLVSAHTSAGKTVVAEYAIAQCLRNKQRVIYTSPIKVRYTGITKRCSCINSFILKKGFIQSKIS